jgi:hypothetical protein
MSLNPCQIGSDFIAQAATQTKLDAFVTGDRVHQFILRFVKEDEFHHSKRLLMSAKTASHGFPCACPASMALMRWAISSSHAASISGSGSTDEASEVS